MVDYCIQHTAAALEGDTTSWIYDEATGLVAQKLYADGHGPCYTYTNDGKLATRTWARGIVTDYGYDTWGNLTSTTYSDGTPSVTLSYDAMGRLKTANDVAGMTTYTYDAFGSEAQIATSGLYSKTLVRHRDSFGRDLGHSMDSSRKNVIEYDGETGRIKRTMLGGAWYTWGYLPGSDMKSSLSVGTAATTTWGYEPHRDLLTQVKNTVYGSVASQYDYTNDAIGRRTAIARSGTMMSESRSDVYGYNTRSELISAAKNGVDEYAYQYDDIGNRETSVEPENSFAYTANELNQYDAITSQSSLSSVALAEEDQTFIPQYDDDGNQTLVKTKTGIWSVIYNGENRPVSWSCGATNIVMKFDRMGRRVEYIEREGETTLKHQKFVYDGYLCIQRLNGANNAVTDLFEWDPTEPVATRPLFWQPRTAEGNFSLFYTHDGNKNVSEVVFYQRARGVAAHYEYAPFGEVTVQTRGNAWGSLDLSALNPWRFSSEYADDIIGLHYYNYRHYSYLLGMWLGRDPMHERGNVNLYSFSRAPLHEFDLYGLAKFLCIKSNVAGKHGAPYESGHAMLFYYETDSTGSITISNTYGLWPDEHQDIINEGLSNPTNTDVRVNFYRDNPDSYRYCHCREIDEKMECKLKCILGKNHSWRITNNCASFASETFEEVTGVNIDADDWLGIETPREIGDSILSANGGSFSNEGAVPRAPDIAPSSYSSRRK